MKYPKLKPEDFKNAKTTPAQREEIYYAINVAHISIKQLAEKYHVCYTTIKYWSSPTYKHVHNKKTYESRKIRMKDPIKREKIVMQIKNNVEERCRTQPLLKEWLKSKKNIHRKNQTTEQIEEHLIKTKMRYYKNGGSKEYDRRNYRVINNNGFRMFMRVVERL